MKRVFALMAALVVYAGIPLHAASTWPAADCSEAAVTTAIGFASDGDTVTIPPGGPSALCTWTSTITIDKAITLQGSGVGSTIILDGVDPVPDSHSSGGPPTITWKLVANKNS